MKPKGSINAAPDRFLYFCALFSVVVIKISPLKKHIVVYSSDLHGNEVQYQKLVDYALQIQANSVIVGGDIAPKGNSVTASIEELKKKGLPPDAFIATQRLFFEERLPNLVCPLKEKNINLFLMMGNDDCKVNLDVFGRGEENGLYQIIHGKRLKLNGDFDIVGYSYVPITPFGIKDWEKYDFSEVPKSVEKEYAQRKKTNYNLAGNLSALDGWAPFQFRPEMEKEDSIQKDLAQPLFQEKPDKTIYVMHCPPNDTNLDIITTGEHVGSIAERLFIKECQPYLTLHGHIHETVAMSGTFRHDIRKTVSLASGNHNIGKKVALLQFDVYDLKTAKRIVL